MRIPEKQSLVGFEEKKEHGDRDFPFTIYPCSIPVDFARVPVHWHEEMEIIAVKKGRGIVTVDRKRYEVGEGEFLFVFPGQLHGISRRAGETVEYENIIFRLELLMSGGEDPWTDRFLLPLAEGRAKEPLYVAKDREGYEEFAVCVQRMDGISGERGYAYQLGIKSGLFWLLYLAAACQGRTGAGEERRNKVREKMKQILSYVEEHYGERITIEEAAAVCYYSPSHFMKYFRQYMGISFVQYLNDYRLARAWAQLARTGETVTNIAQGCGFENLSYFNRLFKRRYGMTPGQMRQRMGQEAPQ